MAHYLRYDKTGPMSFSFSSPDMYFTFVQKLLKLQNGLTDGQTGAKLWMTVQNFHKNRHTQRMQECLSS